MRRKGTGLLAVVWVMLLTVLPGCGSPGFAEALREFATSATKDTAVAFGTFLVEQAVDAAFD